MRIERMNKRIVIHNEESKKLVVTKQWQVNVKTVRGAFCFNGVSSMPGLSWTGFSVKSAFHGCEHLGHEAM